MPNIENPEWEAELPGLRGVRVGAAAGAEKLGATLYEVDPGGRVSPLHIHHGNEELLFVIAGRPILRTPDAERELEPGEVVAFLSGRRGAHQILNHSATPARVLIVSTMRYPEVVEHPDSNNVVAISCRPDETAAMFLAFRRDDAVPVTEGEEDRPPGG
ncbi:MAG: cupin domain-containing protein [Candidatus Rokuibacteriota bacterium]